MRLATGMMPTAIIVFLFATSNFAAQRQPVTIYVTETGNNSIMRIDDLDKGKWVAFDDRGRGVNAFRHPSGINLDSAGRIYVADTKNDRVVRMDDLSGRGWTEFGTFGSGVGQFAQPHAVAIDLAGRIYVADTLNNRIVRIDDMKGTGWTTFSPLGGRGGKADEFAQPTGVTVDRSGRIYVADRGNCRIFRINDMTGTGWTALGKCLWDQPAFYEPVHIALDRQGRIYVAESALRLFQNKSIPLDRGRIVRIDDMTGAGYTTLGDPRGQGLLTLSSTRGVAVDADGAIYVTTGDRILRVDDITGTGLRVLLGLGSDPFSQPGAIAVDSSGRLYVADTERNRIVRVNDMTGAGWVSLGEKPRKFLEPRGVAADRKGRIYVADAGNHRIVRMDTIKGNGWTTLGTEGSGPQQFQEPMGIAIDRTGRLYIADLGNDRIVRVNDITGTGWTALGPFDSSSGKDFAPMGIAVDSSGRIYIVDIRWRSLDGRPTRGPAIIRVNDMTGSGWMEFGRFGTGVGQFRELQGGIALDSHGRIYVADPGNNRIVRINSITGDGWVTLYIGGGHPDRVALDAADRIYVDGPRQIVRMNDMNGGGWKSFGAKELGLSDFAPSWISVVPFPGRPK